jgi:hypothetical protein
MPLTEVKPPGAPRPLIVALAVIVLGALSLVVWKQKGASRDSVAEPPGNSVQAVHEPQAPVVASTPATPDTNITAASVLDALDQWLAQHKNFHAQIELSLPSGTIMGKMDVYSVTEGASGETVRLKAEMYLPQKMQYQAQKKNGKLVAYFPHTDQLVEEELTNMVAAMPALPVSHSDLKSLLKLSRSSFAEASPEARVVTMVINMDSLHLSDTSGDVYVSLRTDNQGKLLGTEEQLQGQRLITKINFLSFDRDAVAASAPDLPGGKTARTNITVQAAMKAEILSTFNKPIGIKI